MYPALVTPCKQDKSRADPLHVAEKAPQENKWGKKHSCKFCSKMVVKMSTHLTKVHAHGADVAAVLRLPKGSKERRNGFVRLLNEGDYKHNYDVLEGQSGTVIPKYRKAGRQVGQLSACRFCQGLYAKSLLSKHLHNCPQNPDPSKHLKWGECSKVGSYMLPIGKEKNSAFFQAVVGRMRDDAVMRVIANDSLIIKFGSRLFYKKDVEEHTRGNISSRLRELGRLVLELKAKSEMKVASLKQALDPIHFDLVIETVRAMAHFEEPSHAYKKGNLALKLGYSLKTCCKILVSEAIKSSDKLLLEKVQNFSSLLASDWHDSVSAGAAQSVTMAKMNKQLLLPSLKDVEKVNGVINEDMQSTEYSVLAKATLASLTIFNRKRGGELQRMKVQDFQVLQSSSIEEEMLKTLTTTEQKLVKILQRVEIKGKFTRPVPILLTPSMVHAVERLLKMRAEKDITSPYLFASSGEKPFRDSDVLRTYAQKAQVDSESLFTATNLRKQLATLSQAMELSKLEEDQLAGFLGHDIRIHRGVYRKPIQIVQKAKVASVLFKLNRGVDIPEEIDEKSLEEEILPADEENEDEEPAATASAEVSKEERPPSCSLSNENTAGACASVGDVSLTIAPATSTSAKGGKTLTQKRRPDGTKTQKKMPWKKEEIAAVEKHLAACFSMNKVPQKLEAERCKQAESSVLKHRSWKDIKYCVHNRLKQIRSK
ncbi:uncharacterized protein [Littorina saxatilis]|uniref:uncharacterized protein n=2 Tax=Littorina saxatilis TaxID=31220 RepID=UPI0038B5C33F